MAIERSGRVMNLSSRGGVMVRRRTRASGLAGLAIHATGAMRPAPATNAAAGHASRRHAGLVDPASSGPAAASDDSSSSTNRATSRSAIRRVRSLSRHRRRSWRIAGGNGGSRDQSGSARRIAAITSAALSPPNGRLPASISKSSTPNAHTSLRASAGRPCACSGDM
jgi:hypothetical protein